MPLRKNVLKLLASSVLIPLGLTASATDAEIQKKKKKKRGGIWYNYSDEMDIVKIVKSLVEYGLKKCQWDN